MWEYFYVYFIYLNKVLESQIQLVGMSLEWFLFQDLVHWTVHLTHAELYVPVAFIFVHQNCTCGMHVLFKAIFINCFTAGIAHRTVSGVKTSENWIYIWNSKDDKEMQDAFYSLLLHRFYVLHPCSRKLIETTVMGYWKQYGQNRLLLFRGHFKWSQRQLASTCYE